jgi:hypothetical protein
MTGPQNDTIRRQWLAMLAKLVAPMDPATAGKALSDMLPWLRHLPDAAFTMASLEAVAKQCKRVPVYGELREHLFAWWNDNRPPQPAIHGPDAWQQRITREHDTAQESWDSVTPADIRGHILTADAAPNGGMRKAMRGILSTAVARHAPQHLGMLPPSWLEDDETITRAEPATRPKPAYLTPEQLAALKRAAE